MLYSNSTDVADPLGLTVPLRVAVVPAPTFVAADVVAAGEFASLAVNT